MRLLTVFMLSACTSQSYLAEDNNACSQDSSRIQLTEQSPIGIDAESYVDLIPNTFITPLLLEGGEMSCLEGAIELDLQNIEYVQSNPNEDDLASEIECLNHLQISASLQLISTDGLLNEIIDIEIELDEIAVQNDILNGYFEQEIAAIDGELGEFLNGEQLIISGVIGENNIGMIRLVSDYEDCEAAVSEERILAAWNDETMGCTE